LVDRVGSFGDALDAAAQRAKLPKEYRTVYVEREAGRLAQLMSMFGGAAVEAVQPEITEAVKEAAGPLTSLPPEILGLTQELAWLNDLAQRRRPFSTVVHCFCSAP
jgi:protease-4